MTKAGIYIHFPYCKVKCIYCDFYSITNKENQIPDFIAFLQKEIKNYSKLNKTNWEFDTIFFGGGTPSLFTTKGLSLILETLDKEFDLSGMKEITMEANPGEAPYEKLKEFKKLGVNRLSIGFQSFNPKLLKFLGRIHSPKDCFTTFDNARKAGFENINADLIFDIPNQTLDDWKCSLKTLTDLQPEHISAYSLTVEKNTKLYSLIKSKSITMPSNSIDIAMFNHTRNFLSNNNYHSYEISNFCKHGFECRHNLHYWNLDKYLAFGPSSHGYNGKTRWWNTRSMDEYFNKIKNNNNPVAGSENLSRKDYYNEMILNGLRLSKGISLKKIIDIYPGNFESFIKSKHKKWNGLKISKNRLYLDNKSMIISDEIATDLFFEYS